MDVVSGCLPTEQSRSVPAYRCILAKMVVPHVDMPGPSEKDDQMTAEIIQFRPKRVRFGRLQVCKSRNRGCQDMTVYEIFMSWLIFNEIVLIWYLSWADVYGD